MDNSTEKPTLNYLSLQRPPLPTFHFFTVLFLRNKTTKKRERGREDDKEEEDEEKER